jgi:DNA-binding response OmpR family regulator
MRILIVEAEERTTNLLVSRLRGKVDNNAQRKLLHTVRGAGFVLGDGGAC